MLCMRKPTGGIETKTAGADDRAVVVEERIPNDDDPPRVWKIASIAAPTRSLSNAAMSVGSIPER